MRSWWEARSAREKALLAIMAALFAVVIYWLGLLRPLSLAADAAERRHAEAMRDHRALQAVADKLSQRSIAPRGVSVRAQVSEVAAALGLSLSRLQPENEGGLTVWVEPAAPGAVFGWIAELAREREVDVVRIAVERTTDGKVQAQATFAARSQ